MAKASEITLFNRTSYYIPRIAAVHDICGYGNCSLAIAMPVLSAAGIDVCPVPTAVFSSHTKYKDFTFLDTTDSLPAFLESWKKINVELDGIYSGFLGSAKQVELIQSLYQTYPDALRILDPVMGDNGEIYTTYTPELCDAMAELTHTADVLVPNLTEAAILTGRKYQGQDPTDVEVTALLKGLLATGAKYVVLKGIIRKDHINNYIAGQDTGIEVQQGELLPFHLHGTGDLYASALTAALYAGKDLYYAVGFADEIVRSAMRTTQLQPDYQMRGVSFEREMGTIARLLD